MVFDAAPTPSKSFLNLEYVFVWLPMWFFERAGKGEIKFLYVRTTRRVGGGGEDGECLLGEFPIS